VPVINLLWLALAFFAAAGLMMSLIAMAGAILILRAASQIIEKLPPIQAARTEGDVMFITDDQRIRMERDEEEKKKRQVRARRTVLDDLDEEPPAVG
jgi:hypothetical protein